MLYLTIYYLLFIWIINRIIEWLAKQSYHNFLESSCEKILYAYSIWTINPSLMPRNFSGRIKLFLKNCITSQKCRSNSITITKSFSLPHPRDNWKASKQPTAHLVRITETWKFKWADSTPVLGLLLLASCGNAMLWSSALTIVNIFRRSLQTQIYQIKLAFVLNCKYVSNWRRPILLIHTFPFHWSSSLRSMDLDIQQITCL